MRTIRLTLSALGGALLVACASKAVLAPDGAVLGRWGGEGAEMVASRDFIDVRYGCELFRTVGPLIPDAAGQFALQLAPRTVGRAVSATLSGTLVGKSITFDAVTTYPVGPVVTSRFSVSKGVSPNYIYLSCTVPAL